MNGFSGPSAEWALRLLLRHGVLSKADVVLSSPFVEETSMSHTSFCVRLAATPRWYVKKADPRRTEGRDLGAEAIAYQLAAFTPELQRVMPKCLLIGENGNAVVLEAAAGEPLSARLAAGNSTLPETFLKASGAAVAQVHRVRCASFGTPPWLLDALEPRWSGYRWLPPPAASLLSRLAADAAFRQAFQRARRQWRAVCLVHGDVRWSNILAVESSGEATVKLIDWELACVGDPAWDVGGLIAEAIAAEALFRPAAPSIEQLSPLCRGLLAGYRGVLQPAPGAWRALLERSVRLAGVRLVQTVLEYAHAGPEDAVKAERGLMPWSGWLLADAHTAALALAAAAEEQAA